MASPYFTEPANILPGLQMIGEGLNRRADLARQRAAKAEEAENMKLAEEAIKSGSHEAIYAARMKNPKLDKVLSDMMGAKDKESVERNSERIMRILSVTDPTEKTNAIIEEAEAAKEAGEPVKPFIDMGIMATKGDVKGVDNRLLMMLAATNKPAYEAYKEQAGMGKKDQWIDWGYGKKKNLSTGEIATVETKPDEGKWIDWGYGQRKNTKTGKIEKVPTPPQKSGVGSAYNASKVYAVTDTVTGKRLYKSGAVLLNDTEGRFTPLTGDVNLSQEKSEARMRGGARAAAIDTANNLYQENAPKLISLRKKVEQKKLFPSGGLKTINQYQSWIGKNISDPDIAELTGKATLIAENLQRTVGGGVGEWTFRITKDLLDPNLSPEAFERRIKSHAEDISKMAESSRGFGKKGVSKPFYEKEEQKTKEQPGTKFERLPNPASLSGKTIRDDKSGMLLKSDGKRWVKVK